MTDHARGFLTASVMWAVCAVAGPAVVAVLMGRRAGIL